VNTYNDKQDVSMKTFTTMAAEDCVPCPSGMVTAPNVVGATSVSQCVVPPGYGYVAASNSAVLCTGNTYNPGCAAPPPSHAFACVLSGGACGAPPCRAAFASCALRSPPAFPAAPHHTRRYNRETCTPCGAGILAPDGSASDGACYVPPGWFIERLNDTAFAGKICPADTYGRTNNTFGLVASECTKCPEFSGTASNAEGATSAAACVTDPGYGWYDGSVLKCDYGYWSAGGSQSECKFCGEGYNTSAANLDTVGIEGATAAANCRVAAGFYINAANATGGVSQCPQGQYKPQIGDTACTGCPSGTTTTIVSGATLLSDCNACDPGFGVFTTGTLNPFSPFCTMCESGKYAPGFYKGGEVCAACPKPELFNQTNDVMVSRLVRVQKCRIRAL
jgi:hypothetical protein